MVQVCWHERQAGAVGIIQNTRHKVCGGMGKGGHKVLEANNRHNNGTGHTGTMGVQRVGRMGWLAMARGGIQGRVKWGWEWEVRTEGGTREREVDCCRSLPPEKKEKREMLNSRRY